MTTSRLPMDKDFCAEPDGVERTALGRRQESAEKTRVLESFFEHSLDSLVLLDRHFNFIRVNEAYARSRGRQAADFPGRSLSVFFPDLENHRIFEQVLRTRKPYQVSAKPFVFPEHPDWGVTYWDWTLVPMLEPEGDVEFLVLSLRDVTQRKRMEQALQHNEERYRSLVTATAQIVWVTNPQGEIVEDLPTWEGFTGQRGEDYRGSGWLEAVHLDDRQRTIEAWSKAVSTCRLYETGYRLRRHDGQYRYVTARGVPVVNEDGTIREWVGTCTDITEREQAGRRRDSTNALLGLFAQKVTLKEYLDSALEIIRQWSGCQALGIRLVDKQRQAPYVSWSGFDPAFIQHEQLLSLDRDDCCCTRAISGNHGGQDPGLLTPGGSYRCEDESRRLSQLSPDDRIRYRGNCAKFGFASLAVVPLFYRQTTVGAIHLADRRPGHFSPPVVEFIESMSPLIGEAVHRFQAEAELMQYRERLEEAVRQRTAELEEANQRLQVEITQRRQAQETLQQIARELERSNRDLEQFAYVASHDLQEPLRAVGGYVRLIEHRFPEKLDEKLRQYIDGAADGAVRMERLITDLLAFSRVGAEGRGFAPADLNLLVQGALQNLQAGIHEAQAEIACEPLPTLVVDAPQIVQLFQNLLANGLKFRSERPVRIQVAARPEPSRWVISVRDNGIGIEPQYFERIFQIFQRLHTRKSYPGTGIGLAICKRIVERHGGKIWLDSTPGEGSTFYFSIPETCAGKVIEP